MNQECDLTKKEQGIEWLRPQKVGIWRDTVGRALASPLEGPTRGLARNCFGPFWGRYKFLIM